MEVPVAARACSPGAAIDATNLSEYWGPGVAHELLRRDWSVTDVRRRIDLRSWQGFLGDLPRDPYVERRWKRMSWLCIDDAGDMREMGECPMAQGGAYNDADTMLTSFDTTSL